MGIGKRKKTEIGVKEGENVFKVRGVGERNRGNLKGKQKFGKVSKEKKLRNRNRKCKQELRLAFINIDGLSGTKKEEVEKSIKSEHIDLMAVLEV